MNSLYLKKLEVHKYRYLCTYSAQTNLPIFHGMALKKTDNLWFHYFNVEVNQIFRWIFKTNKKKKIPSSCQKSKENYS